MSRPLLLLLGLAGFGLIGCGLAGCGKGAGSHESHPDWVIASKVVFLSEDLQAERAPLPLARFRLFLPYIAGDLYGAPTTGDFIHAAPGADYRFEIDLNRSQESLAASLEPTGFSSVPYLRIDPPAARIARLAPIALQADGIEQVGRTDWVDADSKQALLLLYLDRPASITGQTVSGGRPLRYSIRATSPGYVWIARQAGADADTYSVVPKPTRLVLAVTPSDRPTTASPTRTDTPGR